MNYPTSWRGTKYEEILCGTQRFIRDISKARSIYLSYQQAISEDVSFVILHIHMCITSVCFISTRFSKENIVCMFVSSTCNAIVPSPVRFSALSFGKEETKLYTLHFIVV
jgi:hypothetical protein